MTIERHAALAERARAILAELGYDNVEVHAGDGTGGLPEHPPFDGRISGHFFTLWRAADWSSAYEPVIAGELRERDEGSVLLARLRLNHTGPSGKVSLMYS